MRSGRRRKLNKRREYLGTPEPTTFQRHASRVGNLYDLNPSSKHVKQRCTLWTALPSLQTWEAPMLNKRPGSIRAASKAAAKAEKLREQRLKEKKLRKNWLAGDSYTPGSPSQLFARYGAKGAMNIVLRENSDAILYQPWAPKFLNPPQTEDPWVPRMHGSPVNWPLKATYTTGSDLRPKNDKVKHDPRYLKTCSRLGKELNNLRMTIDEDRKKRREIYRRTCVKVGQRRAQTSRARSTFTGAKPSDPVTEAKQLLRRDTRSLWDRPSKLADSKLHYWRGFTVVKTNKEQQNIFLLNKKKRGAPGEMKWREVMALCEVMKSSTHRKPGFADLELLYGALLDKAEENGSMFNVTRNQFASVVKVRTFGVAREKNLHRLFSAFDEDMSDDIDTRDFMGAMRVLWKPSEPITTKLKSLFSLYADDDDMLGAKELFTVFMICAQGDAEAMAMSQDVSRSFALPPQKEAEGNEALRVSRNLFEHTIAADRQLLSRFKEQLLERLPKQVRREIEERGGLPMTAGTLSS
eukprot:g1603.t1